MNTYENPVTSDEESDLLERLKQHGASVDGALPTMTGPRIREDAAMIDDSSVVRRRRTGFLVAAAAVVVLGGVAVWGVNRSTDRQQVGVAADGDQTTESTVDDSSQSPAQSTTTVVEDETQRATTAEDPMTALLPSQVDAVDFGPPDLRYLPSTDSGYVVASGGHVLLSEANLESPAAVPTRTQRVSMKASSADDRRGIVIIVSTFADTAAADLVVAAEPTARGVAGDPMDFDGITGAWFAEEGFAPFSAGNPMRTIGSARVRIGASMVVDVATADVVREDIEALLASLVFDEGGSLETPVPPAGFSTADPIEGASLLYSANEDYLGFTLAGANGEQVELEVLPNVPATRPAAEFSTASGDGWVETGLFGQTIVTLVRSDVVMVMTNYTGQVSVEELIALGEAIEKVDDVAWVERLSIAPLYRNPVTG